MSYLRRMEGILSLERGGIYRMSPSRRCGRGLLRCRRRARRRWASGEARCVLRARSGRGFRSGRCGGPVREGSAPGPVSRVRAVRTMSRSTVAAGLPMRATPARLAVRPRQLRPCRSREPMDDLPRPTTRRPRGACPPPPGSPESAMSRPGHPMRRRSRQGLPCACTVPMGSRLELRGCAATPPARFEGANAAVLPSPEPAPSAARALSRRTCR